MERLINELIRHGYLKTPRIIEAFKKVDRADFVPPEERGVAYENVPLPIGGGQTISQPLTVAFMLELLGPEEGDTVLDIGSGSGWQSALLAAIVGKGGKVYAMELLPKLCVLGEKNASKYHSKNLKFICGNAEGDLPAHAPFDRIIAAAATEEVPASWKAQLKIGGRIVLPVGHSIVLLEKKGGNEFTETEFPGFAFVPFITETAHEKDANKRTNER